jgi:hypothetical protein
MHPSQAMHLMRAEVLAFTYAHIVADAVYMLQRDLTLPSPSPSPSPSLSPAAPQTQMQTLLAGLKYSALDLNLLT